MFYYEAEVKQLILPNSGWEVIFNPGTKEEFSDDVVYFAVCDLMARPIDGQPPPNDKDDCIGIILPVLFNDEEGLAPMLLSYWKSPDEQEVRLRPKTKGILHWPWKK
ncbi:unnamed protein product [marine sediment metagenome]|uniref:Uncharacterized protein n=1 Tax=marine sediment metagenome TaxID=412755 RepID=X1TSX4_9ZZZZ